MRTRRLRGSWPWKYDAKARARKKVGYALKIGRLRKKPCETCGNPKVHAHHADYSKPLEVQWLCPRHHRALHDAALAA